MGDSATPKAKPTIGLAILDQAQRLQAKRASSEPSGPVEKRAKAALELASLITSVAGKRDSAEPLADGQADETSDFLGAPAAGSAEPLSLVSRRQPGQLFALGFRRVRERLAACRSTVQWTRQDLGAWG